MILYQQIFEVGGYAMGDKDLKSKLITDDGIINDGKTTQARIFVFLCNLISLCLAILGLLAFIKGSF